VTATILAVLCAAGAAAGTGRACRAAVRLSALTRPVDAARRPRVRRFGPRVRRRAVCTAAGVSLALVIGGLAGTIAGVVAGVLLSRVVAGLEPARVRVRRRRVAADLPLAVDLLAVCLDAGTPFSEAADAVGAAVGGPVGTRLRNAVAQERLGADPVEIWRTVGRETAFQPLARAYVRALQSGAPPSTGLARVAADQRRQVRTEALARARAAGVHVVAPLGLCFLPAFVLLGIVPAVAGLVRTFTFP
jgi:Flp pilus assembly protein TadB